MPKSRLFWFICLGAVTLLPAVCEAVPIPIGLVAFDTFIGGPGGTNAFFVANLTGDAAVGGFALPPDFPVSTALTFTDARLAWQGAAGSPYALGSIAPGNRDPSPGLQFPDTVAFTSASFTALLSTSILHLTDGRTFRALSPELTALLGDANAGLLPGDFAILVVEATEVPSVPDAPALLLIAVALAAWTARRHAAASRRPPARAPAS